ncbi:hypothetical protein [Ilumatobacter sp.]|uniref:hypothetical protein n=1 Tax=Ilumatobacter sp. TaxID=1967498 RepID=UPI00375145E6
MTCRRGLRLALAAAFCVLAAGCSDQDSAETVSGPENSIDALLPTLELGDNLQVGEAYALVVGTHCGVRVIGLVNDRLWITDEATQLGDWMPAEWAAAIEGGQELIALEVVISQSNTHLIATAERVSVKYRPVAEDDEVPDCM